MDRKGQGISLHVIVIAAIALIVLLVLILIFTGQIGGFGEGLQSCVEKGGKCSSNVECQTVEGEMVCSCKEGVTIPNTDCEEGTACCMKIMGREET